MVCWPGSVCGSHPRMHRVSRYLAQPRRLSGTYFRRLFGAEHKFKQAEIESFFQVLHDVDVIGLIGQTLLMPTSLPPSGKS